MTRTECEKKLAEHLEAMVAILHQYSPRSKYFMATWSEDEKCSYFCFNNESFNPEAPDRDTPVYSHKLGGNEWVSMNV